ncbi:MAG: vapC [Acidobacteria bacterium]|nr:vapC [Acidobacteriota bacterium]
MARLVDASVWIDFTRARSPRALKDLIIPYVLDPEACLAEPVVFEVLRYANEEEARQIQAHFLTLPILSTPIRLWSEAAALGRRCRRLGITAGSLDLLIASVALHHEAELITFDSDFEQIASVSELRVTRLTRPV